MDKRAEARAKARARNCLFAEAITAAQWNLLKLVAVADRQEAILNGKQLAMCERLRAKGLLKICPVGFRTHSFAVQLTNKGSELVMREMNNAGSVALPAVAVRKDG